MFRKVLIANRGEIACRIIRTCKSLGYQTVGIYSEADAEAPHVQLADEAFLVGAPPVVQSYLNVERILQIVQETGCDAIHPGYGLLSENTAFATRVREAGIAFIGPSVEAIAAMGSKIESRKAMEAAGVPVVPGITRPLTDEEEGVHVANEIGYPVMLKASGGGGGIGMQVVTSDDELRKAYAGNQNRAKQFFGDDAMYIEKYIEEPRHVEIQILADATGHTVYLWERECSIQRRHQKVVEEAPSPFLDAELRRAMGEAAVRAAQSIGYTNAGTIEFLVDKHRNFYFLEMNTRLQVEHPVTEEITGLDLVAEQFRIAAGEPLGYTQDEIQLDGHAIEVRIYAEDPVRFLPSPGTITRFEIPQGEHVRHELAVREGSKVTPFYDPMIAKLIVKGTTRMEAITRMSEALAHYHVEGIKTNIPFLRDVLNHEAFHTGDTTTDFVAKHFQKK